MAVIVAAQFLSQAGGGCYLIPCFHEQLYQPDCSSQADVALTDVPFEAAALDKAAPPVEIGFVTDAVEADFDRAMSAGAVVVKRPDRKPWGQLVGYVRDNNGFLVEICSPVAG